MIEFSSNLSGVIRQTERVIANIPKAMESALDKKHWEKDARDVALATIHAQRVRPEDMVYVQRVVDTFVAMFTPGLLGLRLNNPFAMRPTLQDAQDSRALLGNAPSFQDLFRSPIQNIEAIILKWVEEVKKHDHRDLGKTDAEIADFISYVMLTPDGASYTVKEGKNQGKFVRDVLTPHIAEFVAAQTVGGKYGPAPETIDHWLRAVSAAWRALVLHRYPILVRQLLHATKGDLI